MPVTHLLLVLAVIIVWGLNFLFVKIGLVEISPLLLCTLRFVFASIPAIFFIKPPQLPWKLVVAYGLFMFAFQFGFVFTGMAVGMTAGMASLIMQVQIFFSLFFAAVFLDERPNVLQMGGSLISFLGIAMVALHLDADISLLGFLLVLAAAASWGFGNLMAKKMKGTDLIAVVVWGSLVAVFPMLILALIVEGPASFVSTYQQVSWTAIGALAYIVYASTWFGYGAWNWLLNRYSISAIVPFTLLIPIVGMLSSTLILEEPLPAWKIFAALLVMSGLCVNLLSTKIAFRKNLPKMAS